MTLEKNYTKYLQPLKIMTYILDDEEEIIDLIKAILDENGITECEYFSKGQLFMESLNENVHICVVDHFLNNGVTGFEVLQAVNRINPDCKKIVVTGYEGQDIVIDYVNECRIDKWIKKDMKSDYIKKLVQCINDIIPEIRSTYDLMRDVAKWKMQKDFK